MDMNERVMHPADYTEMLGKIRQMDILAMKESVAQQFAELSVSAEQVETLVKNLFIKQVLVIEDHERRQKEGFTKRDVMEACLEVTANEVLDFITAHAELGESSSEVTALILERLAPGAKISEEELDIPVFVHRPAVVSMDELMGPNGEEALRRASEQATINGLLAAGAVQITTGPEAVGGASNDNEEVKVEMNEEFSLMASLSGSLNNVAKNITVRAEGNVRSRSNVVNGGNTLFKLLSDNLRKAS